MPRPKNTERLENLQRQQKNLEEQIRLEKQAATERTRKADERRKELLGAAMFAMMPADALRETIVHIIPKHVKAKADLALFTHWLEPAKPTEPDMSADKGNATEPG